ncbi:MAG: hypothetical protein JWP81_3824 [Ferruginibacter sp.]|nr:hypothetical protein [Ferruginibacter sp.]
MENNLLYYRVLLLFPFACSQKTVTVILATFAILFCSSQDCVMKKTCAIDGYLLLWNSS